MKFIYTYRTSDNVLHEGVVKAATKDAAYALLKGKGIKPGQMKEAPGFFNKLFGKHKRWMAIVCLIALVAVLLCVINRKSTVITQLATESAKQESVTVPAAESTDGSLDRRQLLGDEKIIARCIETEWAVVFPRKCDRFLAKFAQPGHSVQHIRPEELREIAADIEANLKDPIEVADTDLDEYKQIKRIVSGMRDELITFLKDGGTVLEYIECLVQRQSYEVSLRNKAKAQLLNSYRLKSADEYMAEWKKVNLELRAIGLALIPIEEE